MERKKSLAPVVSVSLKKSFAMGNLTAWIGLMNQKDAKYNYIKGEKFFLDYSRNNTKKNCIRDDITDLQFVNYLQISEK